MTRPLIIPNQSQTSKNPPQIDDDQTLHKKMLSRAFTKSPRKIPASGESSRQSSSIYNEYEDFMFGFMDDIPLVSFDEFSYTSKHKAHSILNKNSNNNTESTQMTLRQVLRASVGVIGVGSLGITEKVVFVGGKICAVKRFTRVSVRKREFGFRVNKVALIGKQCDYLVPISAYLYAKRIKFVVCDYYPMGSLADLLSGAKEQGQTALIWEYRLKIVKSIAKAISFIHSQNPPKEKNLYLNIHGNVKSSNVMINIDFTAHLSDYGFVQAAVEDTGQMDSPKIASPHENDYNKKLSQKSDIYNFGLVLLDILGLDKDNLSKNSDFREFSKAGSREEKQASKVYEIALKCINDVPNARPTIDQVLSVLGYT